MKNIEQYLEQFHDGPGMIVNVLKNNEIIFSKNIGYANLEYQIPITSKTVFNLASLSKPFSALGILLLRNEGKLALDDEITDYFQALSYCKGVKIRHLLNHTSGIINYYDILRRIGKSDIYFTNSLCFELLCQEEELLFSPGEQFDYSNSNYVLLALLIEKISNKSLNDFLSENIFIPFNMDQSLVFNELQPIIPNRAFGYSVSSGAIRCDYIGALTTGDGCVFASMDDLVHFVKTLKDGNIVSNELLNEMFTKGKLNNGEDSSYGYGWELQRKDQHPSEIYHSGGDNGTRTLLLFLPQQDVEIIILANFDFPGQNKRYLVNEIIESLNRFEMNKLY